MATVALIPFWKRFPLGFTLLELLFAIGLFAVAMVPILWALNQGLFASATSEHRLIATHLALNEVEEQERLAAQGWANITDRPKEAIADFPFYQREIAVTDLSGADTLKELRATVYWTDQEENSVTVVTYFVDE